MTKGRGDKRGVSNRLITLFLKCQCGIKSNSEPDTIFEEGKMTKSGVKTETIKKQKSVGEIRGMEAMAKKLSKNKKK